MNTLPLPQKTPVADYFRDPKHHTKGAFARRASGKSVRRYCAAAVCRCITGAVYYFHSVNCKSPTPVFKRIADVIRARYPHRTKPDEEPETACVLFNDHPDTTPADVLAVCEEAAA